MRLGASERWRTCYRWLTRSQVLAALAMTVVTVASKYDIPALPVGDNSLWFDSIAFVQQESIYIIIFANVVLWIAWALKNYFGNPWAWDTVKVLLEEFRCYVFLGQTNLDAHLDRVTLFKKMDKRWRCCCIPSFDWLCTVERLSLIHILFIWSPHEVERRSNTETRSEANRFFSNSE